MTTNSASDPGSATEKSKTRRQTCSITGKEYARRDLVQLDALRPSLADRIRQDHPELAFDAFISKVELAQYRTKYVEELLKAEHGDLTELDRQVAFGGVLFAWILLQSGGFRSRPVRSLSLHSAQSDPVLSRGLASACHHDESEAARGEKIACDRKATTASTLKPNLKSGIFTRKSIT
jgi:hypothetical protein